MTDQPTQLIFEKCEDVVRPLGIYEDGEFVSSVTYQLYRAAVYAMGLLLPTKRDFPIGAGIERSQNGFVRLGEMDPEVFGFLRASLCLKGYEVIVLGDEEAPEAAPHLHFFPPDDRERLLGFPSRFRALPFKVNYKGIQEQLGKEVTLDGHDVPLAAVAEHLRRIGADCPTPQMNDQSVQVVCETVEQANEVLELEHCFRDFDHRQIRVVRFSYDHERGSFVHKVEGQPIVLPRQGELERHGVNATNWFSRPSITYPSTFWCRLERQTSNHGRLRHFYLADLLRPFCSLGEYARVHEVYVVRAA